MGLTLLIIYSICLLFIFLFSLGQLHLVWHYLRQQNKKVESLPSKRLDVFPMVTIQLPIYNELYVVERLVDAVGNLDYPKDKFEVQVLDDSTDQTVDMLKRKVAAWQKKGIAIHYIRRSSRVGFKAGALQYGLVLAKGAFIAIFDADFLPQPDFLQKTLPHFSTDRTGVVQTKWGHINKHYSLFTRLQAFGLDAHFTVEQVGRKAAGSFINFNGTAGVWRKTCITDAGGWQTDMLTEDLDLSYRAQLKGWKFNFLEEVESPAELPIMMQAIKSQQFRWNKGSAECARKYLKTICFSSLPFFTKVHAFFHLLNSSVFLFLLLASVLSVPLLVVKFADPSLGFLFDLGSIFLIGFFSIVFFYWVANKQVQQANSKVYFFKTFPLFLSVSMGLSLHNAIAVIEGLLGFKSAFIRTPKFNVRQKMSHGKVISMYKLHFLY